MNTQILGISGSPIKNSNTDRLVKAGVAAVSCTVVPGLRRRLLCAGAQTILIFEATEKEANNGVYVSKTCR